MQIPRSDDATIIERLTAAIASTGSDRHVERLVDLVAELASHDLVTVTRYSTVHRPEFVSHRRYSDEMVREYLETYYPYDPFYGYWRRERKPGVVPLKRLATEEVRRGRYIAEFLGQSAISDEVGVLLADGEERCLGIFLDRASTRFSGAEVAALERLYPVLEALHAKHRMTRAAGSSDPNRLVAGRAPPSGKIASLPSGLWPELTARERELVALILAGHPTATVAKRLDITVGTVKNHRLHIYAKLDITSERELFLQYFNHPPA